MIKNYTVKNCHNMKEKQNIRTLLGISQENLALILQVSRSEIAMYEIGKRSLPLHAMEKLAEILSVLKKNTSKHIPSDNYLNLEAQFLKSQLQKNKHKQLIVENKINTLIKKQNVFNSTIEVTNYLLNKKSTVNKNEIAILKSIQVRSINNVTQKNAIVLLKLELNKEVLEFEEKLLQQKLQATNN